MRVQSTCALLVILLGLVACGGGGGGGGGSASSAAGGTPGTVPAPGIQTAPADATVQEGQSAQFSVSATGSPLTYQWLRNGAAISGATQSSYLFTAQLTDNGAQFSVQVADAAGSVTSSTATLHVTPTQMTVAAGSAAYLQPFTLTTPGGFKPPQNGLNSLAIRYWVEYQYSSTVNIDLPAFVESDGTIEAIAPGGQFSLNVRIKRSIQTSPTAAPLIDYSNTLTVYVGPRTPHYASPGYPTQVLIKAGKYLAKNAAAHNNAFMDSTTAAQISSFDFDGLSSQLMARLDGPSLAQFDDYAAAVLLFAYGFDVDSNRVVPLPGRVAAGQKRQLRPVIKLTSSEDPEAAGQAIAANLGASGIAIGGYVSRAGKYVGLGLGVVAAVTGSPALFAGAVVVGGLMAYEGVAFGTGVGLLAGMVAASADPSSDTPQARWQAISPAVKFFGENTVNNLGGALFSPKDGLVSEYLKDNISSEAYDLYTLGSGYALANSGPLTDKAIDYGASLFMQSNDPPDAQTEYAASVQMDAPNQLAAGLDSSYSSLSLPAGSTDDTTLESGLDELTAFLQKLSSNASASPALNSFVTCAQPYYTDVASLAQILAAGNGLDPQQEQQLLGDAQGVLACGNTLFGALSRTAPSTSVSASGTSSGGPVEVTAANCDGRGCWITEQTTASNGISSTETGYRSCYSDGFCPMYLH